MKKTLTIIAVMLVVAALIYKVKAGSGDLFSVGPSDEFRVTGAGFLAVSGGVVNMPAVYLDIATASETAYKNTSIAKTVLASATSYVLAYGDYTNMITPRNVSTQAEFAGTGIGTTSVSGTMTFTGKDARGFDAVEVIALSTNVTVGNVAWSSITSVAQSACTGNYSGRSDTTLSIQIGSGVKIGLPGNVNTTGDILKVIEAGSLSTTYTLETTYDTITFAAAPNNTNDYQVWFKNLGR